MTHKKPLFRALAEKGSELVWIGSVRGDYEKCHADYQRAIMKQVRILYKSHGVVPELVHDDKNRMPQHPSLHWCCINETLMVCMKEVAKYDTRLSHVMRITHYKNGENFAIECSTGDGLYNVCAATVVQGLISNVKTAVAFQRRGYAEIMMRSILWIMKQHNVNEAALKVYSDNEVARRLYKRVGFETDNDHPHLIHYIINMTAKVQKTNESQLFEMLARRHDIVLNYELPEASK